MKKEITSYILARMFRAASEDEIIYSVCQKTGLDWKNARALVEQVRDAHLTEIEDSQIPLKSFLAFIFYIMGLVLAVGPFIYLWIMLDVTRTFLAFVSHPSSIDAETALELFIQRCVLLGWFELPAILFTILLGVGIINVNLRYMRGLWQALFRRWDLID